MWGLALLGGAVLVGFNAWGLRAAPEFGLPRDFIFPGNDLVVYLRAAASVAEGRTPYPTRPWGTTAVYHYSPFVAVLLTPLFANGAEAIPFRLIAFGYLGVIVALLPLAWWLWQRAFRAAQLPQAETASLRWAPIWLVYSQWFADQNYLNLYTLLLALVGALTWAVLHKRTGLAVLLAIVIAQTKPHYLFPLLIPGLLGQWRFTLKLALGCLVGYAATVAVTFAVAGTEFGVTLYRDYLGFLTTIPERYPWVPYQLMYNNSWRSMSHWVFGFPAWEALAVNGLRALTAFPLVWIAWRWWRARRTLTAAQALGAVFALHVWALTALDQVWEATTLIVVFAYVLALASDRAHGIATAIFWPYALLGFVQLIGWRWLSGDFTSELPVIMAATLGMYGVLVVSLRRASL